jgi:hypothetical protein
MLRIAQLPQGPPAFNQSQNPNVQRLQTNDIPSFAPKEALRLAKERKDTYIASPQKQIGIEQNQYELSLPCRPINQLNQVYRGNGLFYNRQLLSATPHRPLDRLAFTRDRIGAASGFNAKQPAHILRTFG